MINNISIIIPARNEEENLRILIPALIRKYKRYILEVIIVDDNSTDNTYITSKKLKSKYRQIEIIKRTDNPGVGNAIREGLNQISRKSKYVLLMDSDFTANVADIYYFIREIPRYDGVTGSRFIRKSSLSSYPKLKLIANRSFFILGKLLLGINNSDLTNNFKLYRKEVIEIVKPYLVSRNFAINAEIGFYPILLGMNIGQVPVHWKERTGQMGLSKFKIFKVGPSYLRIFLRLLMMKWGFIDIRRITNPPRDTNPPRK